MANEITHNAVTGLTLYFCRFQQDGDVFLSNPATDEVWGTGGRTAADYDVAMTEEDASGHYKGTFATGGTIAAGVYQITVFRQTGAGPANSPTDVALAQGEIYWNGTTEETLHDVYTNIGTPANIDTGGATIADNLKKLADDGGGLAFDATRDSLAVIRTRGDLAWVTGTSAGATNVYTISTLVRTVGDNDGGSSTDVNVQDGNSFSTGELGTTTKLEVDATFVAAVDETPMSIMFWGYYAGGGGHYQRVQAYNYVNSVFEDVGTIGNGTVVAESSFGLTTQHINLSTGAMAVKFLHSSHAGVIAHALHIDKLLVTTSHNAALITAVEAILVDTNEIQGKLPDDYIMGSSVTTSMDDEINNINANSGKVVYGSVSSTSGVPKTITAGSVTGFVPDEDRP